jgi:hypothetical protein
MYQPMLFLHWKQVRFGLIPFILAAFALPGLAGPAGSLHQGGRTQCAETRVGGTRKRGGLERPPPISSAPLVG